MIVLINHFVSTCSLSVSDLHRGGGLHKTAVNSFECASLAHIHLMVADTERLPSFFVSNQRYRGPPSKLFMQAVP
jgi:hypothetical protein